MKKIANLRIIFGLLWVLALSGTQLRAGTYSITVPDITSRGWYGSDGVKSNANGSVSAGNYYTGIASAISYNNYFVFDLSSIAADQTIVSVTLNLFDPSNGVSNPNATPDTYQLYSVDNTSVAMLQDSSTDASTNTAVFNDLGSGTAYSLVTPITAADEGITLVIPLNTAFVNYAQANLGGYVELGGSLATQGTDDQYVFGYTQNTDLANTTLSITTVPEPSTLALALLGSIVITFSVVHRLRVRANL